MYDQRLNLRRRMAKVSFSMLILTVFACFLVIILGNDQTVKNFAAVSGTIATVLMCFTSLVVGYGVSAQRGDEKNV